MQFQSYLISSLLIAFWHFSLLKLCCTLLNSHLTTLGSQIFHRHQRMFQRCHFTSIAVSVSLCRYRAVKRLSRVLNHCFCDECARIGGVLTFFNLMFHQALKFLSFLKHLLTREFFPNGLFALTHDLAEQRLKYVSIKNFIFFTDFTNSGIIRLHSPHGTYKTEAY